jgi:aspartate/methionine/tyrosine aminotransferase
MSQETTVVACTACSFVPFDRKLIRRNIEEQKIDLRTASIREMNRLVNAIEKDLAVPFVRMEFGIPGLPTHPLAIEAEIRALRELQVGHVYAPFDGLPALKEEAARFVRLFMDIEVPPSCCIPTIGAMEGCFASLALAGRLRKNRRSVLFLDPGFPVNRLQARFLGLEIENLDFYDHRGTKLLDAVETLAAKGEICAVLWSSPNNPTWISLKEEELSGLGRICDQHGILAIEDLAYFGMDVRNGEPRPGKPPYQPTVLRYTDHGISLISSSKMFSYAGQRIAIAVLSPELVRMEAEDLVPYFGTASVGHALAHGVLYPIAASVPESPQYGLLALLRAANEGDRSVFQPAKEYARRAAIMKRLFLENGFQLVYDNDLGEPLADGFYFTISHPGYHDGVDLLRELLHYGISAITLEVTGSCRKEGLRACVSMVGDDLFETLEARLRRFKQDHCPTRFCSPFEVVAE